MTARYTGTPGKGLCISHEEMRSMVIEYLADHAQGQFADLRGGIGPLAAKRYQVTPDENGNFGLTKATHGGIYLHEGDLATAESVIWDLIIEGVIRPGHAGSGGSLPFYYVTEQGKAKLNDPNTPYDPDKFLRRLQEACPSIDPVIIAYLEESLHTFRIGCLLSATITLGCASEKAILLLVDALGKALLSPKKEAFHKKIQGKMIKGQYDELRSVIDLHVRGMLPIELKDGLDIALTTLFTMFRTHRNDAGHPTGKVLSREEVYASIAAFPFFAKKANRLLDWIQANPVP